MTQKLMVGDLQLERARVPRIVELGIVRVDKGQFLV